MIPLIIILPMFIPGTTISLVITTISLMVIIVVK